MIKRLLSFLVIASFVFNANTSDVSAEEMFDAGKFPYKEMQIQVMPEFDYPENWPKEETSLLVGQYGTIINKSGKDFDGKVEIPVPVKEKNFQIYLVAEFPSDDKPEVQRPFEVNKEKGVVSFKPEKPIKNNENYRFVVEYYSNPIATKEKKSFIYEYATQTDIETLDVIVYAPLKSSDIVLNPKPQNSQKSDYGEQIYSYQNKAVKKGTSFKYEVSYKKEGNESTLSMMDKNKAPADENHTGGTTATDQVTGGSKDSTSTNNDRPIIGAAGGVIIGVSIIIAGMFVFFGLRGRANNKNNSGSTKSGKSGNKQSAKATALKKEGKARNAEIVKELRKKLLDGKIDQEAYDEQVKKLL